MPIWFDSSFVVAVASGFVAIGALWVAKKTLELANMDWRQRKWFDLYAKGNEAYDALERFQISYPSRQDLVTPEGPREWNSVMSIMRSLHTLAVVFPKCQEIDNLAATTAIFRDQNAAFSKDALKNILQALEGIRQRALVDVSVLGK